MILDHILVKSDWRRSGCQSENRVLFLHGFLHDFESFQADFVIIVFYDNLEHS